MYFLLYKEAGNDIIGDNQAGKGVWKNKGGADTDFKKKQIAIIR